MVDITTTLIGRQKEKETLLKALNSHEPEMVAIIGRRSRIARACQSFQVFDQDAKTHFSKCYQYLWR